MSIPRQGRLAGRTALITGASRGIGEAIALAAAAEGARLVLVSRKEAGLHAAAERIGQVVPGCETHVRPCHTGDPAAIERLFQGLDSQGLLVDALVNNAAANPYFGPLMLADWSAWDKTFEVNVKGPFELSRQVARRLIAAETRGAIVNISSIFGLRGAPFQGIYAMTKAAMISQTRTLALEWGGAGIRVNAMAPGLVDTRFASALIENEEILATYNNRTALGRPAQPAEIAGMAITLLSDESSYTTGQVMVLDGGYTVG